MKYLAVLLLFLLSCSVPERINVTLTNSTDKEILIRTRAGWFKPDDIRIPKGETWTGWIPRSDSINSIRIEIHKVDDE